MKESAFPREWGDDSHPGMSLRDYIAIAAMQGFISHPDAHCRDQGTEQYLKEVSQVSYKLADAMIEQGKP